MTQGETSEWKRSERGRAGRLVLGLALIPALAFPGASSARALAGVPEARPDARMSTQDVADEREERALRRVLVLTDGHALRGPARRVEDAWIVELAGREVSLPVDRISRVGEERDLLRELARRRKRLPMALDVDDRGARVEIARWALENGLHEEALTTIDSALRRDADDSGALAVLAALPLEIRLPDGLPEGPKNASGFTREGIELLVRFAGQSIRPTTTELVARRLAASDPQPVRDVLIDELHRPEERRRETACVLLRRLFTPTELLDDPERGADGENGVEVRALVRRAALDVSSRVRDSAARSLRHVGHEGLAAPLVRALDSRSPRVAMNAAEALGVLGHEAAVGPLVGALFTISAQGGSGGVPQAPRSTLAVGRQVAYVSDYDVEIAQGASIADPKISVVEEGVVLTAASLGISGTTTVRPYTVRRHVGAIVDSLRALAGEGTPQSEAPSAWRAWWSENRSRFEGGGAAAAPGSGGSTRPDRE